MVLGEIGYGIIIAFTATFVVVGPFLMNRTVPHAERMEIKLHTPFLDRLINHMFIALFCGLLGAGAGLLTVVVTDTLPSGESSGYMDTSFDRDRAGRRR